MSVQEISDFAVFMTNENDLDEDNSAMSNDEDVIDIIITSNETKEDDLDDLDVRGDEAEYEDNDANNDEAYCEEKDDHNAVNIILDSDETIADDDDKWETWLGDSGASCHVSNHDKALVNVVMGSNDKVVVGDSRKCMVTKKGNLQLISKSDDIVELLNVRIVKEIEKNIISIGKLLNDGWNLEGCSKRLIVTRRDVRLIFIRNSIDGLYYTKLRRMSDGIYNQCNKITTQEDKEGTTEWKKVEPRDKKKWPKMSREEAHGSWDHPHLNQL